MNESDRVWPLAAHLLNLKAFSSLSTAWSHLSLPSSDDPLKVQQAMESASTRPRRGYLMAHCKSILSKQPQLVMHQYEQVCESYRAIDDFRGKLLALWPILGGAAGGVTLLVADDTNSGYLWAVALFGLLVSAGLAVYEWNQTLRCVQLKKSARALERCMGFEVGVGQFRSVPAGFKVGSTGPTHLELENLIKREDEGTESESSNWESIRDYPVRVGVASLVVYGAVILGWFALFVGASVAAIDLF